MTTTIEKQLTGLEGQLFNWERWETVSTAEFHFYECVLKKDIGSFKKGSSVQCILFSVEKSKMEFYDENAKTIGTFDLEINVK